MDSLRTRINAFGGSSSIRSVRELARRQSMITMPISMRELLGFHFVELFVEALSATQTTESGVLNNRDEIYFIGSCALATHNVPPMTLDIGRISPLPPENYFGLSAGEAKTEILLAKLRMPREWIATYYLAIMEQDNAQLSMLSDIVTALSTLGVAPLLNLITRAASAVKLSQSGIDGVLRDAQAQATRFTSALKSSGDQIIGTLVVIVANLAGNLNMRWAAGSDVVITSSTQHSADFTATGAGSSYFIRLRLRDAFD